jgi:hypothetical protein
MGPLLPRIRTEIATEITNIHGSKTTTARLPAVGSTNITTGSRKDSAIGTDCHLKSNLA